MEHFINKHGLSVEHDYSVLRISAYISEGIEYEYVMRATGDNLKVANNMTLEELKTLSRGNRKRN